MIDLAPALLLAAAAALAWPAHAEGGLPGSLKAVGENAPTTLAPSPGGASTEQPATAPEEPGGAILSPFATPAATRWPAQGQVAESASDARASDHALPLVVATAGIAAVAWLLMRSS